jgi:trehalose 6-phosphate phosphatase
MEGKMMVELRPPVNIDKGTAAVALSDRLGVGAEASLLYAGDDRTDEDAFRALRRRNPRVVTVRVLSDGDGGDGKTDSEITLRSTEQLRRVLELLAARREASSLRA